MISFAQLCKIEPYLLVMESQCKNHVPQKGKSVNDFWYKEMKPILFNLVGFHAHNEQLRNTEAYGVAYQHLYDCLPND